MQNGSKRLVVPKSEKKEDEGESGSQGFTFNMNGSDDEDGGDKGQKRSTNDDTSEKWKPKIYKWKFNRGN